MFMTSQQKHLENLSEIRNIMERSSRFISLSGLSGIFAGIAALAGVAIIYSLLHLSGLAENYYERLYTQDGLLRRDTIAIFTGVAISIMLFSIVVSIFFTTRRAKQNGQKIFDGIVKRMLINLAIPLGAGAVFCFFLLMHDAVALIAPATMIFYGMALINGGKFTLKEIRWLGLMEVILGLIACAFAGYGLVFWAIGFGLLHIAYGAYMYIKYER